MHSYAAAAMHLLSAVDIPPTVISDRPAEYPEIAIDPSDGSVNVVWQSVAEGLFFQRSTDQGKTFSTPVKVADLPGYSFAYAQVAATNGTVAVVWTAGNSQIQFTRSLNGGASFENVRTLASGSSVSEPSIAIEGDTVAVAWSEWTPHSIRIVVSTDRGVTFPTTSSISSYAAGEPRLAIDASDVVNLVWSSVYGPYRQIRFSSSTDSGATFSVPTYVAFSPNWHGNPDIALDVGGGINVAVNEEAMRTLFSRSAGNGQPFTPPVKAASNIANTRLSASGSSLAFVGIEAAGWPVGGPLYYFTSSDYGAPFSAPKLIIPGYFSQRPSLAVSKTGASHVVGSASSEVWYTRVGD